MTGRCDCAHTEDLHPEDGPCSVSLPEFLEEELPAWRCPCPKYAAAPAGPWRWHTPTQSWAAVVPGRVVTPVECAAGHRGVWLARCPDCRQAREETLTLLASVQSCTVHNPSPAADQCVCPNRCPAHPFTVLRTAPLTGWGW